MVNDGEHRLVEMLVVSSLIRTHLCSCLMIWLRYVMLAAYKVVSEASLGTPKAIADLLLEMVNMIGNPHKDSLTVHRI